MASHGLENSGVSDQASHGKCQCCCGGDGTPSLPGNSSLVGSHTEGKSSIEICGVCSFDSDHADDLVEENCHELKGSDVAGYDLFKTQIAQVALLSADTELPPASTAIGFDERMLLHREIEIKTEPTIQKDQTASVLLLPVLLLQESFPQNVLWYLLEKSQQEELMMVHTPNHIVSVEQTKNMLYSTLISLNCSYFTADTYANDEHSACAAKLAAGLCVPILLSLIVSGRRSQWLLQWCETSWGIMRGEPSNGLLSSQQCSCGCISCTQRAGAKKVLIVVTGCCSPWKWHKEIFEGNKSVGTLDGKGFSVNIPWGRGGVGDNDYIFAFQNVVLPIAAEFAPDITIISAGFDAARGDPLGCCDVTPAGYSRMTSMLTACSEGKLLVILEGGYNLRSISSSATEVVKVLLGDGTNFDTGATAPSKDGLKTVLQVLKIQQQFWPVLGPAYALLQAQQGSVFSKYTKKGNELKKKKHLGAPGPFWWKMGSKRLLYEALFKGRRLRKIKATGKGKADTAEH
ncbi:hypothetical protein PR202_ga28270 [Eleusine coracana subsp. coracana]|uniref:histone deacetylase n=1 Tax=Eleusine coracana subsp. coracana TaxID=191504 RepID=A0AAV5DJ25_ELECO|nr:hypothetical protein PR202_ga28270 [Eleusine coracana subsp. coracana]